MKHADAFAIVCALAVGCSSNAQPAVVVAGDGTLTLDWTINGTKDPDQCTQGAATTLDVTVDTIDGVPAGEFQQACDAFATTIHLAPGSYTGSAVLLAANGRDRTTTIQLDAFTIRSDEDLNVPIDFPARSFE